MRKIDLHGKCYSFAINTLLDGGKISEIEFKLGINDCENAEEIEDYIRHLEYNDKLLAHYQKFETHKDCWLFYFIDNIGNKYYLCVSKE